MDRTDVAQALGEIATLLELKGESPFRVRTYHAAARAVAGFPGDLRQAHERGILHHLRGLGPATLDIVDELLTTGRSRMLEDLRDQVPPGLAGLMQLGGLGVAKVRQIHESLHVDSLEELEAAARDGRLAALPRFGPKTAERILRGVAFLRQAAGALLVHHARRDADAVLSALAAMPGVERAHVAGSVRRRCELARDIDVVVVTDEPADGLCDRLRRLAGVADATRVRADALHLRLEGGSAVDLFLTPPASAGVVSVRATGSETHVAQLATRAAERGAAALERALRGHAAADLPASEEEVYTALGLPWIPPELREGEDEITLAETARLPALVEEADLHGFLHCHSDYSDGTSGVADWAAAARAAGYDYLGITDHSPATAFGGGLTPEDALRQHAEIDRVNADLRDFHLLKGVEADILADGTLDYTPDLRRRFDFIIASVHSRYAMSAEAMTARILRAMDDPTMTILGHPTGRLLLSRDAYPLDLSAVFARAAERGVAIEINADPQRLDLDWRLVRQAAAAGVTISIGADAHGTSQAHHMGFGVGIARKGRLTAAHVLNTRPLDGFRAFAARRSG